MRILVLMILIVSSAWAKQCPPGEYKFWVQEKHLMKNGERNSVWAPLSSSWSLSFYQQGLLGVAMKKTTKEKVEVEFMVGKKKYQWELSAPKVKPKNFKSALYVSEKEVHPLYEASKQKERFVVDFKLMVGGKDVCNFEQVVFPTDEQTDGPQ